MANRREQIIQYGKAQGKSQAEIDKALAQYDASVAPTQPKETIGGDISNAFMGGLNYARQGYEESRGGLGERNPIQMTESGLKIGAGLVGAAFSPLAPATKYIGKGVEYAGDKVSNIPEVQKFAGTKAGETTARVAEDVQNTSALLSVIGPGKMPKSVKSAPIRTNIPKSGGRPPNEAVQYIKGTISDMTPTKEGFINHQVAQSFNLTPTDLNYISAVSKDNVSVGKWLADNDLIGTNADETKSNIQNLTDVSYKTVRDEIGAVTKVYNADDVPRYKTILSQIQDQVDGFPGLEDTWLKANEYLKKNEVELNDVQTVKEMLDARYKIYKRSGDTKDGQLAEGMANMRAEVQKFIEDEVRQNSGADIHTLNNNVRTGKAILESIDTRASKTFTKGNWRPGDLQTLGFATFAGGALFGLAALFVKKVLETPTIALKIAKYVDKLDDARKAQLLKQLQKGDIPNEFRNLINIKYKGQRLVPGMLTSQQATTSTNMSNDSINK